MTKCYLLASLDDIYKTGDFTMDVDTIKFLSHTTRSPDQTRQEAIASLRAFKEKLSELINEQIIGVMFWLNNSNIHPFDVLKTLQDLILKVRTSYEIRISKDTTFGSCMR